MEAIPLPELSPYPQHIVRVPELTSVPFTDRVRALIDHPWFQRLRNVRQLGLTHLVYPGATHSRFEHALGVYFHTIRYVHALMSDPRFRETMTEYDLSCVLLAALLHDIGQFPFAHAFEEIRRDLFRHERYSCLFIAGGIEEYLSEPFTNPACACSESIRDRIAAHWNVEPDDVAALLSPEHAPVHLSEDKRGILHSIIDGPVDADKMDYLFRDSIHTGVPYGRFLDTDRFLQSLTVDPVGRNTIALSEKGRICAELFLICRYAMFSEVYWHHTVRALSSMAGYAVRSFLRVRLEEEMPTALIGTMLTCSDDELLAWLGENGPPEAGRMVARIFARSIYRRLLVLRADERDLEVYERLSDLRWHRSKEAYAAFKARFIERINRMVPIDLSEEEILIDIPDPDTDRIGNVNVIPEYRDEPEALAQVSHLWGSIREDFPRWVRKIRVFCSPERRAALLSRGVDRLRGALEEALKEVAES